MPVGGEHGMARLDGVRCRTLVLRGNRRWFREWRAGVEHAGGAAKVEDRRYLRFTLAKAGWDTLGILSRIARRLRINPSSFAVAGLKDKTGLALSSPSATIPSFLPHTKA